jgi:glycosyltransferase involved in cell wall biosynthesis
MCTISVIIPTYKRPAKLAACLEPLARQSEDDEFEVLVGLDGPDEASRIAAEQAWLRGGGEPHNLRVIDCPKAGLNATRNRLLAVAKGKFMLSMNDDVLPTPRLVWAHLWAQEAAEFNRPLACVVGYSPFVQWADPTLFDHLCARTSMLFFYDTMIDPDTGVLTDPDPYRDWGFRHCWGLNFSAPLEPIRDSGGFLSFENQYGYDDIEIAHRLKAMLGTPVYFEPTARADHDHRYTPREVLAREFKLGISAWHFAGVAPEFAREVFGRDIRSSEHLANIRAAESAPALNLNEVERELIASGEQRVDQDIDALRSRVSNLYQRVRELKRSIWRRGVLHAAEGAPAYEPSAP